MKGDIFQAGEAVRISAAFLRSIDPNAAKGWPTTYDHGKGIVIASCPCADFYLVTVWFKDIWNSRTYNSNSLIRDNPVDVYNEAMRAEHKPRLT